MRYEWGRDHRLLRDGDPIGTAAASWWRERASVTTPTGTWKLRAPGWRSLLATSPDGQERMAAVLIGRLLNRWTVTGQATYDVRQEHLLTSRLVVRSDGTEIGTLTPAPRSNARPVLEIAPDPSLPDAVLLLWVAHVTWHRSYTGG